MSAQPSSTLFDKRLINRQLKAGLITEKELKKRVDDLPDLAAEAQRVEAEFEHFDVAMGGGDEDSEKEDE